MAEDQGKEGEKFDFTRHGEAVGYISLDQARLLAIEHSRGHTEFYGSIYAGEPLVWEVLSAKDREDYYEIKLSFRPPGRFRGQPGIDQFIFNKTGALRVRQMLDEPTITPTPTPRPHATSYYSKGNDYYNDGKYQLAIEEFTTAIRLIPSYINAYAYRARAYFGLGQYKQAIEDYDQVIRLDPDYANAYLNRDVSYASLGEYQRAIQDFDKAVQLDPDFTWAYKYRGDAYGGLGQYQQAIQDYDKAIQLDPDYAKAYIDRGVAYRNLGQYQRRSL